MNLTARKIGQTYWQQIMLEQALNAGKKVLVINQFGSMIMRRRGHLTCYKRVKLNNNATMELISLGDERIS